MKRIFELVNVMVPVGMTVSHACTLPVPPSAYNTAQKTCYEFLEVSHNVTCRDPNGITDDCAPILPFVNGFSKLKWYTELLRYIVALIFLL